MTPEELDGIALRLTGEARAAASTERWDLFAESIAQAIREAVAEEREHLLALINIAAEKCFLDDHFATGMRLKELAKAIRNTTHE